MPFTSTTRSDTTASYIHYDDHTTAADFQTALEDNTYNLRENDTDMTIYSDGEGSPMDVDMVTKSAGLDIKAILSTNWGGFHFCSPSTSSEDSMEGESDDASVSFLVQDFSHVPNFTFPGFKEAEHLPVQPLGPSGLFAGDMGHPPLSPLSPLSITLLDLYPSRFGGSPYKFGSQPPPVLIDMLDEGEGTRYVPARGRKSPLKSSGGRNGLARLRAIAPRPIDIQQADTWEPSEPLPCAESASPTSPSSGSETHSPVSATDSDVDMSDEMCRTGDDTLLNAPRIETVELFVLTPMSDMYISPSMSVCSEWNSDDQTEVATPEDEKVMQVVHRYIIGQ